MALELTGFGVTFLEQSQALTGLISRSRGCYGSCRLRSGLGVPG